MNLQFVLFNKLIIAKITNCSVSFRQRMAKVMIITHNKMTLCHKALFTRNQSGRCQVVTLGSYVRLSKCLLCNRDMWKFYYCG